MKYFTLALITSVAAINSLAQNLVPNPSFEEYLECPFSTAELDNQVVDWYSWSDTPDFFHECSNDLDGFAGVPENVWGYQWPMTGSGYAGVSTFMFIDPNLREYMAAPLLESLVIGQSYYVSFHASLYNGGNKVNWVCATNHLGLRFFKDPNYTHFPPDQSFQPDNFAHLDYTEILTDSVGWTRIEGTFIADENYNWLAIGNFFTDENTTTQILNDTGLCWGMYYIENVCVAANATDCDYLLSSIDHSLEHDVLMFPNPVSRVLNVQSSKPISQIEVCDAIGNKVSTSAGNQKNEIALDMSFLPKGLYVLRVFSKNSFSTHKILKE